MESLRDMDGAARTPPAFPVDLVPAATAAVAPVSGSPAIVVGISGVLVLCPGWKCSLGA